MKTFENLFLSYPAMDENQLRAIKGGDGDPDPPIKTIMLAEVIITATRLNPDGSDPNEFDINGFIGDFATYGALAHDWSEASMAGMSSMDLANLASSSEAFLSELGTITGTLALSEDALKIMNDPEGGSAADWLKLGTDALVVASDDSGIGLVYGLGEATGFNEEMFDTVGEWFC